jgi:hypothetical protein
MFNKEKIKSNLVLLTGSVVMASSGIVNAAWTDDAVTKGNALETGLRLLGPIIGIVALLIICLVVLFSKDKSFGDFSNWIKGAIGFAIAAPVVAFFFT